MSDTAGWWANKLGGAPQARQQAPQAPPPQQYAPQGYAQPQHPQAYAQPGVQIPQQYAQPQHQQPQRPQITTMHDVPAAAATWEGGEGTKTETGRCPSCGGNHYFSRAQGNSRLPPPAPSCFSCGYNGQFTQGDQSNWVAA